MTPLELAEQIAAAGKDFDPAKARTEYGDAKDLWRLYLDLTELDLNKLKTLVEKHSDDEDDKQYALRQSLASVVNLIPSIVDVIRNYIFSDEPTFDAAGDADIEAFLADCDGNGTSFRDWIKHHALPMALSLGWIDALVANPVSEQEIRTEADAKDRRLRPVITLITPLQRVNWSCRPDGSYNWLAFKDRSVDPPNPLVADADPVDVYIRLAKAGPFGSLNTEKGTWIRSEQAGEDWEHTAGYTPTARVPVASLFYRKSNDADKPHWGISKIAMMAVLTKAIIQVLSWTTQDVLANLAILALPTKGGKKPLTEDGAEAISSLGPFSTLYFDQDASRDPMVVQGDVSHIKIKIDLVRFYVAEILRLAHLSTAEGEGGANETSGFHAVVNRNELFQELSDIAGSLDAFAMDVFALVKSWAQDADVTRESMAADGKTAPRAVFSKGPYTVEPLSVLIKDAQDAMALLRDVSPTLSETLLKRVARAVMYADDPSLKDAEKEIEGRTKNMISLYTAPLDTDPDAPRVPPGESDE